MPKVINKRMIPHSLGVYIGRPSKWGNPYSHLPVGTLAQHIVATRQEAVDAYRQYLLSNPKLMNDLHELRGKDLICWCAPNACHGDILLELANK